MDPQISRSVAPHELQFKRQLAESSAASNRRRRWPRILLMMILALALVGGLALGASWGVHKYQDAHNPFPAVVRHGVTFPLYYPSQLPNGYTVDNQSFTRQADAVIFSIKAPNGKVVAVSEQAMPHSNTAELGPQDPPSGAPVSNPNKHVQTPIGNAVIGLWGANYVSSIVAGNTWIILNVSGFTASDAEIVSRSFVKL